MTTTTAKDIDTRYVTLSVSDGTTMPAYVARPTHPHLPVGLLVLQEAFGVNAHIRDVTERFARLGYTAIAPALFHRTDPNFESGYTDFSLVMPHMQALTEEGMAADAEAAYQWLTDQEIARIGSIGYCLGGRVSFLADSTLPLQASVSYYGGGIAPNPARNLAGLLGRTADLHGPILLFWGGMDAHIGKDQRDAVEVALQAAGKNYTQVTFAKADHGFFCDERASYQPDAARESWALTLAFFDSYLRG